jgi:hypothetical protein
VKQVEKTGARRRIKMDQNQSLQRKWLGALIMHLQLISGWGLTGIWETTQKIRTTSDFNSVRPKRGITPDVIDGCAISRNVTNERPELKLQKRRLRSDILATSSPELYESTSQ